MTEVSAACVRDLLSQIRRQLDHAPLTAFAAKLTRSAFGDSLLTLRFFPALAVAAKVLLTGLLVIEFGEKRLAIVLACPAVVVAPANLAVDNLLPMNAFEPVFWTLCVYFAGLAASCRSEVS